MPRKASTSKPAPKKASAKKTPTKKAVAKPKAEANRKTLLSRNAEIREIMGDFTISQMVALFKNLDTKATGRLKKAVGKLDDARRKDEIRQTEAEIDKLTKKLKMMKG
jgi:hypothetical protein